MRAAFVTLLLVGGCAIPLAAQESRDAPLYAGRPLVDVLQDLNRRGLRIVFSTSLVPVTLRVSSEPSGTPRDILDQLDLLGSERPHLLAIDTESARLDNRAGSGPVRDQRDSR